MLASQPHYFSFMLVIASVYVHSWRDGLRGSFLPLLCAVVFLCIFDELLKKRIFASPNNNRSRSFLVFSFVVCSHFI